MGDRANIYLRTQKGGIGIYSHWGGVAVAEAAAKIVASKAFKARLGDPGYAMRIGVQIALETLGAKSNSETGFGLWTPATGADDNEYPYVVIDVDDGTLYVARNWKKVSKKDRVAKPTSREIKKRMLVGSA